MNITDLRTNENASKKQILERLNTELKDFFKRKTNNPKASLLDDIYQWNDKFWKKIDKDDFEKQCRTILSDYEMSGKDERDILKDFILNNLIDENKIDMYSRNFFCMENCVLCFEDNFPAAQKRDNPLNGKSYKELKTTHGNKIPILSHNACKEFHITHCSNISFKRKIDNESMKLWASFLNRMIPKLKLQNEQNNPSSNELKEQTIAWLNEFILSLITGKDGNAFFLNLLGPAQCGKSTLVNFLINSLGNYAHTLSKDDLIYSKLENTYALYNLKDARLLIYSEASRRPFNASFIKEITGGTQFKYGERSFKIKARLLIDSNYLLQSEAKTDNAFDERYALIPVGPSIPREERDITLDEKLYEARNDIFSYLLNYYENKAITIPECSEFYKKLIKFSLSPAQVFYQSCFHGYEDVVMGAMLGMTHALKEEDIWIFYLNNFRILYSKLLRDCPYFNYSEEYVNELLDTRQKDFISELVWLHQNISKACSGNTMKYRFNELAFNSNEEIESMSLTKAFHHTVRYSDSLKKIRKEMNLGVAPI